MAISKIQSFLSLPSEEFIDMFKPIQYGDIKGILILSNKRVIFAKEKGLAFKSYNTIFSVELTTLADMQVLAQAEAKSVKLGEYVVASQDIGGLIQFYNERIFAQVQTSKGLVKYKEQWMKPEEKFEQEQKDKGFVKYKDEWMTPEEKFKREQVDKGLVEYKGRWMKPRKKFEQEMQDKGFVKYKGKWMTPEEKFEQEQKDKCLLKFMGRWGTPEQVEKWKKLYAGLTSDFMDRSPHEFEDFIAELFMRMGYSTERTPLTSDYGADVIAKKGEEAIAVQVKRNKPGNDVGVKDVNQVLGSMYRYNANKAIVITTSDFTLAARKLAKTAPVDLWNRTKLYEMIERHFFGESKEKSIMEEVSSKKREIVGWLRKARALYDLQKYHEAIEACEWVLELTKDFGGLEEAVAAAWTYKGSCLYGLTKFEEAIECFDKALEINPTFQAAQKAKTIVQEEIDKQHVELHEKEGESEAPIAQTILTGNLNLTAKGNYSNMTILHVAENNEFTCPITCMYYDKQDRPFGCPKWNLMTQKLMKDRLVCTTVLVRVKNVSSQLLVLEDRHFLAFDSFGNQHNGDSLCFELHPKKYGHLVNWYKLYSNAQVTCLLCFPQLPADCKITRIVGETWIAEHGIHRHVETQDIKIAK